MIYCHRTSGLFVRLSISPSHQVISGEEKALSEVIDSRSVIKENLLEEETPSQMNSLKALSHWGG